MRNSKIVLTLLGSAHLLFAAEFRNLGFDEANPENAIGGIVIDSVHYIGRGTAEDLLPGWRFYLGDMLITRPSIELNGDFGSLGPPQFGVIAYNARWVNNYYLYVEGNYAFYGSSGTVAVPDSFTFIQEGFVPEDVTQLSYRFLGSSYAVYANDVPLQHLGNIQGIDGPHVAVFDISPFAGQEIELRLTGGEMRTFLDSIELIPEPSTLALGFVAAGVLLSGLWRRFQRGGLESR